jgi:hypothetical protein
MSLEHEHDWLWAVHKSEMSTAPTRLPDGRTAVEHPFRLQLSFGSRRYPVRARLHHKEYQGE